MISSGDSVLDATTKLRISIESGCVTKQVIGIVTDSPAATVPGWSTRGRSDEILSGIGVKESSSWVSTIVMSPHLWPLSAVPC